MPKKREIVDTPQKKRTVVYIDGYNFYYGRLRGSSHKWLDVVSLFEQIIAIQDPESSIQAVKFFTAYALAKFATHGQASIEAQQAYHRALTLRHPERLEIVYGSHSHDKSGTLLPTYRVGEPFDRTIQSRVWKIEEKQTDVNLAIAMYRDAAKGLVDHLVICSNDSDAEPELKAIREDFPQLTVGVITPIRPVTGDARHRSISASLSRHAHWTRQSILDSELEASQLPDHVPTNKKPIRRPGHW
jgi:uncharacterized LabA/DUF88 family protein